MAVGGEKEECFLKRFSETGGSGATREAERDSETTKGAFNVLFFFFFFLSREKDQVEVTKKRETDKDKRRDSSPRIHCGWLWEDGTRRVYEERETKGGH